MTDKGLTPNVVTWTTFVSKFFAEKTGPELLEWAWGARAKFGTGFGYLAFGPAITGYRKLRRFEDALWIIASYANLPASEAFFRSTARAKLAEAFFCARLAEGYKPKDVSFALAKLNQVIGNRAKTVLWAEKALALPDQHPKRRAELERMLAGTR